MQEKNEVKRLFSTKVTVFLKEKVDGKLKLEGDHLDVGGDYLKISQGSSKGWAIPLWNVRGWTHS